MLKPVFVVTVALIAAAFASSSAAAFLDSGRPRRHRPAEQFAPLARGGTATTFRARGGR